ncbi:uncharacterized protein LOC115630513 [Scaptodrosophila lebanonensis]|uniref:Uncharacterized protein LOC115630513 n=1 Tax=Drosophila lebanonensis TaxID=7225 RepID=A0A6J2U3I6_DROLE|nr:uncharacterized protein LOC115630513 [Scaptodrosophila lebanonensis]
MTTWGNICRICSGPADYDIFAKIPTFLHAGSNEFLNWQKKIGLLLEETTGLKNSPDDGLPRYICAPCISYLKHAVTFREQSIKNALSLKLAELYQQKSPNVEDDNNVDKENVLFTAEDLRYVEQRPVHNLLLNNSRAKLDPADKVHKQLLNQTELPIGNCEQRIQYLNVLFDKDRNAGARVKKGNGKCLDLPTTSAGSGNGTGDEDDYLPASSSDEENELSRRHKNCYNYSETNFKEDDPMENAGMRDIKVNIPQPNWKERKCPACSKRFMFEDSYKTHIENCVEHQFLIFVAEVNKLLEIRRQKMVSPHEFIRRMIFSLHKTCTWLQEHSIDTLLAEKLNQVKVASNGNGHEKSAASEAEEETHQTTSNILKWADESDPFDFPVRLRGSLTPITAENNVLYAIERSASRSSQSTPVVKKPIPIRGTALKSLQRPTPTQNNALERATFLEKLQRAGVPPVTNEQQPQLPYLPATPTSLKNTTTIPFSARCGQCNLSFDSVSELEVHNVMHHNGHNVVTPNAIDAQSSIDAVDDSQRRRIIALFEDDI